MVCFITVMMYFNGVMLLFQYMTCCLLCAEFVWIDVLRICDGRVQTAGAALEWIYNAAELVEVQACTIVTPISSTADTDLVEFRGKMRLIAIIKYSSSKLDVDEIKLTKTVSVCLSKISSGLAEINPQFTR